MKIEHMIVVRYVSPTGEFSRTFKTSEGQSVEANVQVPPGAKDYSVSVALPKARTKSLLLDSDFAASVKSNDAKSPSDTVSLAAEQPRVWVEGGPFTAMFGSDVSVLLVSDESTKKTGGMFKVRALVKT